MATHSSILAWRIPWTEDPGGLQSMEFQGAEHNWAKNTFIFMFMDSNTYLIGYWTVWGWYIKRKRLQIVPFSSVAQSCLTLCDSMNCSTPGLPVHHQLPESTQTHVHWVGNTYPTISSSVVPFSSCPQSFPASGSFQMRQLFAWGGQSIGVWALTSVFPMNTQEWSRLGWTGWISLQSKGLSRVFSNTTVQKH